MTTTTNTGQKVTTSGPFKFIQSDFVKAFFMAVIGAVIAPVMNSLNAGSLSIDWHTVLIGALTAGVGYLVKNFFSTSVTVKEPTTNDIHNNP